MGVYDEFVFNAVCPWCKTPGKFRAQTKSFINALFHFRLGQKVKTGDLVIREGTFKARTYHKCGPLENRLMCLDDCGHSHQVPSERAFNVTIHIEGGKFSRVTVGNKIDLEKESKERARNFKRIFGKRNRGPTSR